MRLIVYVYCSLHFKISAVTLAVIFEIFEIFGKLFNESRFGWKIT